MMAGLISLVICVTVLIQNMLAQQCPTHQASCIHSSDHTLVLHPGPGCKRIFSCLTPDAKIALVEKHNELRQRVASGNETKGLMHPSEGSGMPEWMPPGQYPASNMIKLEWDDELAFTAQRWADQCKFSHDADRSICDKDDSSAGQNIASFWTSNQESQSDVINKAVESVQHWYDEVADFNPDDVISFQFDPDLPTTGHYTQVVWAETNRVGCGLSHYHDLGWYKTIVVCNYAPAGNFIGKMVYHHYVTASGEPEWCTNCADGLNCDSDYFALCS
eukprot:GFUD01016595.1.p1 GENE.GFUD01016595.1~~GFUD01016595.1.p1  ORF type:complete len:275 (+),score=30.42 GFUD01016595.1:20-844(+)